jgi:hypothetical protein
VATTEVEPASSETPPASESSSKVLPPLEQDLAQSSTKQPKAQPKNVWRKLARIFTSLFSEMVDNPKLQIRISATASGVVPVNADQRELRGTVHSEAYVSTSFLIHKRSELMVFLSVTL